jgi:hypothetical protein
MTLLKRKNNWTILGEKETTNLLRVLSWIIDACWILADAIWAVTASVCARRSPNTLMLATLTASPSDGDRKNSAVILHQ